MTTIYCIADWKLIAAACVLAPFATLGLFVTIDHWREKIRSWRS
jgi:hypothetical protein